MRKLSVLLFLLCVFVSCHGKKDFELQVNKKPEMANDSVFFNAAVSDRLKSLQGMWDSEMICNKSGCGLYVIGDRRSEKWEFINDSVRVYNLVWNKKKLLSVFKADFAGDNLVLKSGTGSLLDNPLKIKIILDHIRPTSMKGQQTMTGKNDCTSIFLVELKRIKK